MESSGTASGQKVRSPNYPKFMVYHNYQKRIWARPKVMSNWLGYSTRVKVMQSHNSKRKEWISRVTRSLPIESEVTAELTNICTYNFVKLEFLEYFHLNKNSRYKSQALLCVISYFSCSVNDIFALLDVTKRRLVGSYRRFGKTYPSHLQGSSSK